MIEKNLAYYMGLPYRVEIYPEEDGSGYTAIVPDLPGCMTSADTLEEVWDMIEEAKALWLEVALADGDHIPEPAPLEVEAYSGKFVVRLPRSLHRQLAQRAQLEDTSLNQIVVMLLADGMGGWRERGGRSSTQLHHYYAQTAEPTTIREPRGGGAAAPSSPEEGESLQREDGEASE